MRSPAPEGVVDLGDDGGDFGPSLQVTPPGWIEDNGEVGRRICAKKPDFIGCARWWEVAEVARLCRGLVASLYVRPARRHVASRTVTGARRPATLVAVIDVAASPVPPAAGDHRASRVGEAAARLCAAIDDRAPVDPALLDDWVDDAIAAVREFGWSLAPPV